MAENEKLRNEVDRVQAVNDQMIAKEAVYAEEQKEAQRRISELEQQVKELTVKALDPSRFAEWDWEQILFWIMSLEGGPFKKYESELKSALSTDKVTGEELLDVTPLVLKAWGIKDRKESVALNGYIQRLVQQNGAQQPAAPMAFAAAPK